MGIADQFKDKAQELADQAKQKKPADRRDGAQKRPACAPGERSDRGSDQSGVRERAQDAADRTRERFER
ncbi:hypothetical protein [Streptomyces clavifer]